MDGLGSWSPESEEEANRKAGGFILEAMRRPKMRIEKKPPKVWIWLLIAVIIGLTLISGCPKKAFAEITECSYYTRASCIKESGQYRMANGRLLDDTQYTCASWDYRLGSVLVVQNIQSGKSVRVIVSDRGPSRRLYRMGRKLDLSKKAFAEIARLEQGVIKVLIEK